VDEPGKDVSKNNVRVHAGLSYLHVLTVMFYLGLRRLLYMVHENMRITTLAKMIKSKTICVGHAPMFLP
jgi:hypothetical protein